jgi:hypothetical protein
MVVAPVVTIHFPALDPFIFAIKESFMEAVHGVIMFPLKFSYFGLLEVRVNNS